MTVGGSTGRRGQGTWGRENPDIPEQDSRPPCRWAGPQCPVTSLPALSRVPLASRSRREQEVAEQEPRGDAMTAPWA